MQAELLYDFILPAGMYLVEMFLKVTFRFEAVAFPATNQLSRDDITAYFRLGFLIGLHER
jgi:hypothetical protein